MRFGRALRLLLWQWLEQPSSFAATLREVRTELSGVSPLLTGLRGVLAQLEDPNLPSLQLHKRVPSPSIQKFFPQHFGLLDDPRLGFPHSAAS